MPKKLTREEWIAKANAKHGEGRYDYSEVVYINIRTKVKITCNKCGHQFPQDPQKHAGAGRGCTKCAGNQKKTREEWIAKAKAKHGDRYDYSDVVYVNWRTKVDITCNECGTQFPQRPADHANKGCGCPACGEKKGARRLTREEWIAKANAKHGEGRYDYSEVVYVNSYTKVRITCNECGTQFPQKPCDHANSGSGCPKCAGNQKMTREEWIAKANAKHGEGRYDYSEVVYVNSYTKVRINCNECGTQFPQTPDDHANSGRGCPECLRKTMTMTAEEWIAKANAKHGEGRYDYSEVVYVNSKTKVQIKCNECGAQFPQMPNDHDRGVGCPVCRDSKMNKWGKELAEDMELAHKPEYWDDTCRDKSPLPFDLAVFDHYEVKVLCEFQGRHHYEPVNFGGCSNERAEADFKDRQIKDQIKRDWCAANNIPLIEIHYKFKDKGEQAFKDELRRQLKSVGIC